MESKIKYQYKKTPLDYQITEYDCGTTTLLNALRYLFDREEILPETYIYIMRYTLDKKNSIGEIGKGGTSVYALEFLSKWLNENNKKGGMKVECEVIPEDEISIYNAKLEEKINNGGAAILSVYEECEHYCLLTKLDDEYAYIFDPYYLNINYYDKDSDVEIIKDRPFEFNRKVRKTRIEECGTKDFSLVRGKNEAIVLIDRADKK